jgi:hypothetical protein
VIAFVRVVVVTGYEIYYATVRIMHVGEAGLTASATCLSISASDARELSVDF